MPTRSLLLCLAAVVLGCTTTSDDGAESTGAGPTTGASTGSASSAPTTGPASASSESSAADPTTGDTTGPADPTTGGPITGVTVTEATTTAETTGGSTTDTGVPAVSFTEVYEQVIMPNGCNAGYCHGGGAGGLEMTDEATSYANLVEVTATTARCDQSMRVVPGAKEASILWYRVRPAAQDNGMACAPKMPQGSMGLTDAEAKLVDDWISGGALE
jgi:hypothetical protein